MAVKVAFIRETRDDHQRTSDQNLIEACGRGDRAALGILFRKYHLDVYRFVARITGNNNHETDDLVQDTFLGIQQGSKRFAGRSSVKSWIFSIAANVVKNSFRSESRRSNTLDSFGHICGDLVRTPFDVAQNREAIECVQSAMSQLTHEQRVVFVMCVLEDIKGVEAARTLQIRPGTLWRRLHEARKILSLEMERRHV